MAWRDCLAIAIIFAPILLWNYLDLGARRFWQTGDWATYERTLYPSLTKDAGACDCRCPEVQ